MNLKICSAIFILCLTWGYLWVPIKISLQNLPPFFFTSSRLLIGALCLLIVQAILGNSILPNWEDSPKLLILSCLMCIGYYGLSTFGMQYVDSGLSAILVYTMPIMIGVLAHFFLGERLNKQKIIGLILGLIGIFIILFKQLVHLRFNLTLMGELLLIASAFFWAWATVYMKKNFQNYDKVKLTIWQLLIGGIILYAISYMTESLNQVIWSDPMTFVYLGYSSILGTALAFLIWNWIVSKIDASLASISIMTVPLIGILFGHIQLHEPITINILLGTVFICLGIIRCTLKSNH